MTPLSVLKELVTALENHPDFNEEGTTAHDLLGRAELILEYPNEDTENPSRQWSSGWTDFVDISDPIDIEGVFPFRTALFSKHR